MASNPNLRNRLAASRAAITSNQSTTTVMDLLKRLEPQLQRALPKHMTANRFMRVVLTDIRRNPKLLNCSPESLMGAIMTAGQLGLEPGPLGHAYLVPFKSECTLILGYKGLIDLARRSGNVESIIAREVCRNDEFDFAYGLEEVLVHRPNLEDRGEPYAWYGIAHYKDGGHTVLVMSKPDIEKRRARSRAKNDGPWVTDYDAMAKKTVIRAMASFLPLSIEAAEAIEEDDNRDLAAGDGALRLVQPEPEEEVIDSEAKEVQEGDEEKREVDPETGEIKKGAEGELPLDKDAGK